MLERGYFSACSIEDGVLPTNSKAGWLLSTVALATGILGMSAAWVTAAVLLHLTRVPPGRWRVGLAIACTAAALLLSQWLIIATQLGISMGLQPLDASLRLGPALAWQLGKLSLTPVDLVLLGAALPLAGVLAQRNSRD
jgi:hypothetical protein